MKPIPFSGPDITEEDLTSVLDVIKSGWLAHGKYSKRLEEIFCQFTGSKYAIPVSNCTAGLHLSCMAAGFGSDDEVIVPAQTHTATAHAVEYTGAKAVFADVDPVTGNIQTEDVLNKISDKTKGIIPVHMAGYPVDLNGIMKMCQDHELTLIEDCAHAIGTRYDGKHVGNYGITGNFSFYPTKQITTGEGGLVICNDKAIMKFVRKFMAFGIDTPPELRKKPGVYDVQGLGYNYRMTDFQAALGAGQMERYNENLKKRHQNAKYYTELLAGNHYLEFPIYTEENSYFLFQILIKEPKDRNQILLALKDSGIGVSIHYATPVPLMSYYRKKYGYTREEFPNAVQYGNQCISLPVHSKIDAEDVDYISKTVNELVSD